MTSENPFEVLSDPLTAAEAADSPQYGPITRLRFIGWSIGGFAFTLMLFVALLQFAGGLGMLALPLLQILWYGGLGWLTKARLRNAGLRQWWLLISPALVFACYPALLFANAANATVITSILSQLSSLLAILNLPILLICAAVPTAFADRKDFNLPSILLPAIGGAVAVIAVIAMLFVLL